MIKIRIPRLILMAIFLPISVYSLTAGAETYFECDQVTDPLIKKVCAAPSTVEKARRFNASYQQAFAESKTYQEVRPAVKIKNDYRSEVAGCRAIQEVFPSCLDTALDNAIAAFSNHYHYATDALALEPNALKEAAHKNATLLKDQARKIPTDCMKEEAKKSDDNVSPASDIGRNIALTCTPKANEFVAFANDTLILWDVLNLIPRMNYDQLGDLSERSFGSDAATKVVLETRVEKYKAGTKASTKKKKRKTTAKQ
jgi:uncharacterized protein